MAVKIKKPGRPKSSDKVRVVSAYLKDSEKKRINNKYGSITDALRIVVLPKCPVL